MISESIKDLLFAYKKHINTVILPIVKCQWGNELFITGNSSQAGGLAVLLSRDLNVKVEILYRDRCNSFMVMKIFRNDESMILVNVYCPTADRELEQLALLDRIEQAPTPYLGQRFIFAGDFNVTMQEKLERLNYVGGEIRNSRFREELRLLLEGFEIVDPWRIRNAKKTPFHLVTW